MFVCSFLQAFTELTGVDTTGEENELRDMLAAANALQMTTEPGMLAFSHSIFVGAHIRDLALSLALALAVAFFVCVFVNALPTVPLLHCHLLWSLVVLSFPQSNNGRALLGCHGVMRRQGILLEETFSTTKQHLNDSDDFRYGSHIGHLATVLFDSALHEDDTSKLTVDLIVVIL